MGSSRPTIVITGISSGLGRRLVPFLADYEIIGVDSKPPASEVQVNFFPMDLSKEESCLQLTSLLQKSKAIGVAHLGFIAGNGNSVSPDRLWHNNVPGTARVMEAVTEANRELHLVEKFIYPSTGLVYGPEAATDLTEDAVTMAESSSYGQQYLEADRVVQERAPALRGCSVFMLRPAMVVGADFQSVVTDAFRGTVQGAGRRATRLRQKGERLSYVLPLGEQYLQKRKQFVHVDDLMRLIAFIFARKEPESQRLTILNLTGRGDALTVAQCIALAKSQVRRVPGIWAAERILERRWKAGLSAVPPAVLPYLVGESLMSTERLRKFLAADYENVIHYTNSAAFSDSLLHAPKQQAQPSLATQQLR